MGLLEYYTEMIELVLTEYEVDPSHSPFNDLTHNKYLVPIERNIKDIGKDLCLKSGWVTEKIYLKKKMIKK